MTMLVGPLMGVTDPGKVRNQRVVNLRIVVVLLIITIINILIILVK